MTLAAEPMTRRVVVAPPELSLKGAWDLMARERFRHLPIVSNGKLVAILSDRDILVNSTVDGDDLVVPDISVAEAATSSPFTCEPETDVCDVVKLMVRHKIDALPVLSDGRLIGLVTSTDLMMLLIRLDEAKIPLPFLFEVEEHRIAASA